MKLLQLVPDNTSDDLLSVQKSEKSISPVKSRWTRTLARFHRSVSARSEPESFLWPALSRIPPPAHGSLSRVRISRPDALRGAHGARRHTEGSVPSRRCAETGSALIFLAFVPNLWDLGLYPPLMLSIRSAVCLNLFDPLLIPSCPTGTKLGTVFLLWILRSCVESDLVLRSSLIKEGAISYFNPSIGAQTMKLY